MEEQSHILLRVGTAGHISGKVITDSLGDRKKLKALANIGCPINRGAPTIMFRQSFINMCLKHQEKAELVCGDGIKRGSRIAGGVFVSNNHLICGECRIGRMVRRGVRNFKGPKGIEFRDLVKELKHNGGKDG